MIVFCSHSIGTVLKSRLCDFPENACFVIFRFAFCVRMFSLVDLLNDLAAMIYVIEKQRDYPEKYAKTRYCNICKGWLGYEKIFLKLKSLTVFPTTVNDILV